MFHRIVANLLLAGIFAGGLSGATSAHANEQAAVSHSPLVEIAPRLEEYSVAEPWEFIRNSSTDQSETIECQSLLSWRPLEDPEELAAITCAIGQHQAHLRPSGLIFLCDRAVQKRSGVLKS